MRHPGCLLLTPTCQCSDTSICVAEQFRTDRKSHVTKSLPEPLSSIVSTLPAVTVCVSSLGSIALSSNISSTMKLIHAKLDSLKQSTDRIEGKLDTLTEIMHQLLEQIPEPGSGKATGREMEWRRTASARARSSYWKGCSGCRLRTPRSERPNPYITCLCESGTL